MAYDPKLDESYLATIGRLDIETAIKRNTEVIATALPSIDGVLKTQKLDKMSKDVTEAQKELQAQTDKVSETIKAGGDKYTKVQDTVKKAASELPDQIESLVSNTGLSDLPSDIDSKLSGITTSLTDNLNLGDSDLFSGLLDSDSVLESIFSSDLTKQLSGIDFSTFKGSLGQGIANFKDSLDGLSDNLRGSLGDVENLITGELNALLSSKDFDITNSQSLNTVFKALEASGGDPKTFMAELERSNYIVRGNTISGLRTVPSAIQSRQTNPGQRQSTPYPTTSNSNPATSVTGGQPGRLAGTRVSAANSDPRQIPRQDIIDALDYACTKLDIYVQITPQGGWTGRKSGTKNHPTGWAADVQVLKDGGGLIRPKDDPVLYGEFAAHLKHYGYSKGKTPGIGEYPNFIHYDEYPPRTASHYPGSKSRHWGSGWNMLAQIKSAEGRLGLV